MKKDSQRILLYAVIAVIDFLSGFYWSLLSLAFLTAVEGISARKRRAFQFKLDLLKVVNPHFRDRKEKLVRAFGSSDLTYEDYCLLLEERAGNKNEKNFFSELRRCRNSAGILHLIRDYESQMEKREEELPFDRCLFSLTILLYSLILPYCRHSIISYLWTCLLNLNLVLNEFFPPRFSPIENFFLSFNRKLSYMFPKESFESTLEECPKIARCFETLIESVRRQVCDPRLFSHSAHGILLSMYGVLSFDTALTRREIEETALRIRAKKNETLLLRKERIFALAYLGVILGGIAL